MTSPANWTMAIWSRSPIIRIISAAPRRAASILSPFMLPEVSITSVTLAGRLCWRHSSNTVYITGTDGASSVVIGCCGSTPCAASMGAASATAGSAGRPADRDATPTGQSLSRIVTPSAVSMSCMPEGLAKRTLKASVRSRAVSPTTPMRKALLVSPAAKVTVPEVWA
mgnify:CR=1 FL=1